MNHRTPHYTFMNLGRDILISTQGDSGEKVNILRGDNTGHCEKKKSYEHVSGSEWLPRHSCLNLMYVSPCIIVYA